MVTVANEGENNFNQTGVREQIKRELDKEDGDFAYNPDGQLCVRRSLPSSNKSVLLPIDLDKGLVHDPVKILPYHIKPGTLGALRDEVGWEPPVSTD